MNKNNNPAVFSFDSKAIRTFNLNGEVWFSAIDVCGALSLTNSRDALGKLDDDEKGVALTDTPGGIQQVATVNESGMYALVLRCRSAMTKGTAPYRFRRWVTSEVLPSIRKTGTYTQKGAIVLTEADATNLAGLLELVPMFKEVQQRAESMMREARSPLVGRMHDAWHETGVFAWTLRGVRERCAAFREEQGARFLTS
jgi:prophage antirepressor-like protein